MRSDIELNLFSRVIALVAFDFGVKALIERHGLESSIDIAVIQVASRVSMETVTMSSR